MKLKIIVFIFICVIYLINTTLAADPDKTYDEKNKTLTIKISGMKKTSFTIQQVSEKTDLTSMEVIFKITSYENYTFKEKKDFKVKWKKFKGKKDIIMQKWEILENEQYNVTVPDFIDSQENITISNIQSYIDITDSYESNQGPLDWGEPNAGTIWSVTTPNGTFIIGFENYVIDTTDPLNITFSLNTTQQVGTHIEPKYRDVWKPFSPDGRTIERNESIIVKLTLYKKAEKGEFSFKTIPIFSDVEHDNITRWNSSWDYRIDNPIPDGIRPYQVSLTISNSTGVNNATHVFLNGQANNNFSDIRFTLDNETVLPYWIENSTTGKVWVNITSNGTVNLYYGNPSAPDLSDGESTFEFYDSFDTLDLGSNPVLLPTESWELPNLRWGSLAYLHGMYYIYYSNGASATSNIGRATSTDLIHWTKESNPVIDNSIGPSLLKELDGKTPVLYENKYWMLTMKSAGTAIEIRSALSLDSDIWTLENNQLISKVPDTWYENYLYTTSFVREDDKFYIIMEARDNSLTWRIGLFESSAPNGPYTDHGILLSPSLLWEGTGVLDPEMRKFGDTYYLFYTGNIEKPLYQNSYATSVNLAGPYIKSEIQITPISNTYPAIFEKDTFYYILTDDHVPVTGTGKNLFKRKDLNGMFGSPFEYYQGGSPTISGSELLINADGEYIRSKSAFLYRALKIRAKYAPLDDDNSIQYFGFNANSYGGVTNSTMICSYDTEPHLKAWSGNSISSEDSGIFGTDYFGSYHTYEILWRTGEAKFIIDDEIKATHTTNVTDTPQPIGIFNFGTDATLYVDWIFVRNYVYPELEWAIWNTEQTFSEPSFISFINPTPENNAILTQNYAYLNIQVQEPDTTAFIDWNRALVGWWRFNNEIGEDSTFFKDWSSWGNNVSCAGIDCPAMTSGKFGNALGFNGSNDSVFTTSATGIPTTSPFTIESWVNVQSVSHQTDIFRKDGSWALQINKKGKVNLEITGKKDAISHVVVPMNVWTHLAVTFEDTTVKFYKDGILMDTRKNIKVPDTGSNSIYIGGHNIFSFDGAIDEVKIHNRVLSPEEIKASYHAGTFNLYMNFKNLANGIYTYKAYIQNTLGTVNQTEIRTLTVMN